MPTSWQPPSERHEVKLDFPSPVVKIAQSTFLGTQTIRIPQNEKFRTHHIFEQQGYAIPPEYIPSGPLTIVDIGANVGLFAIYMKSVRCDSNIYCFEPVPQTLALLEKNTQCHQGIYAYPYALSDHDGSSEINLHPFNSGENSLKHGAAEGGASVQVEVRDAAAVLRRIGLTYIDILKVDTEGCEVEILSSLQPFLPYVGIVMAEYHSDADRRSLDALLPNHLLFDAEVCRVQLGLVKYINSRLIT